jgi:hypothetical protein
MSLKVIGAGLGRTGTLSLKLALEHLGFDPCHHMVEVLANMEDQVPKWLSANGENPDWARIFAGYQATVDYPGCSYWRPLVARYPDAKVILSLRDPDSWFKSVSTTIFSPPMIAMMVNSPLQPFFENSVVKDFGDRIADAAFMTDYFRRWNDAVIAQVPADRLLVFEARQGWGPLCAFLDVPVPDVPYPRVNSSEEMLARNAERAAQGAPGGPPDAATLGQMAKANLAMLKATAFGTGQP